MIKSIIFVAIFLVLGEAFFVQKQHEKKAALELRKKRDEAVVKAHLTPSPSESSLRGFEVEAHSCAGARSDFEAEADADAAQTDADATADPLMCHTGVHASNSLASTQKS